MISDKIIGCLISLVVRQNLLKLVYLYTGLQPVKFRIIGESYDISLVKKDQRTEIARTR